MADAFDHCEEQVRSGDKDRFLATLFASSRLGAIFVPLNFRLAAPEVADILAMSEPVVIVSEEEVHGVNDRPQLAD